MKKILNGITIIVVMVLLSCRGKSSVSSQDSAKAKMAHLAVKTEDCLYNKTLDGEDAAVAAQRIKNFDDLKKFDTNKGKAASVWFNIQQIESIYNLLMAESSDSIPKEQRIDGVRFYFACDRPANGATKLNVSIYLVSTRQQDTGGDQNKSEHGDYYCHSGSAASYLDSPKFGIPSYDINIAGHGGLYGQPNAGVGQCPYEPSNYVDEETGHQWVKDARYKSPDAINTKSEWFNLCFIQHLFNAMIKNKKIYGGLRVYLALGSNINDLSKDRDIVLLVPTDNNAEDSYKCIGTVAADWPISCDVDNAIKLKLETIRKPYLDYKEKHNLTPNNQLPKAFERIARYLNFYSGGYDQGELCPDKCN